MIPLPRDGTERLAKLTPITITVIGSLAIDSDDSLEFLVPVVTIIMPSIGLMTIALAVAVLRLVRLRRPTSRFEAEIEGRHVSLTLPLANPLFTMLQDLLAF